MSAASNKEIVKYKCRLCEREFERRGQRKRFCSIKCQQKAWTLAHPRGALRDIECPRCGFQGSQDEFN